MKEHRQALYNTALKKIQRYCAYRERCPQEVRQKLASLGIAGSQAEEIIVMLTKSGFLDEQRFASLFAYSKFRLKKWGRLKITKSLMEKGIPDSCIRSALEEIDNEEYHNTLTTLLNQKLDKLGGINIYQQREKASKYGIQKGYEPEIVWDILKELKPD